MVFMLAFCWGQNARNYSEILRSFTDLAKLKIQSNLIVIYFDLVQVNFWNIFNISLI